jgi:hypothetical protein
MHFHRRHGAASIRCGDWRRIRHGHRFEVLGQEDRDAYAQDQCKHASCQQCPFEKIFHGFTPIYAFDSLYFKQAGVKIR